MKPSDDQTLQPKLVVVVPKPTLIPIHYIHPYRRPNRSPRDTILHPLLKSTIIFEFVGLVVDIYIFSSVNFLFNQHMKK